MKLDFVLAVAGAILGLATPEASAAPDSLRDGLVYQRRNWLLRRDYPLPLQDPFYNAPSNLSAYKPGDVIEARKITPEMKGLSKAGDTYQIHYRTTTSAGNPSSSVTTVIQPPSGGPQKMLSYHLWEDAAQRDCAPSYTVLKGDASPNVKVVGDDVPIWFNFLLSNGISVVVPDYEGPDSALFSGFTAGYAILDSARAVRNHLQWNGDAEVAMTGYSEGAHVTAWAANLAPSYAPDLNVVGATHGGTPIDMELTLRHFDGSSFSGFSLGGIHGMMVDYKDFADGVEQYGNQELKNDLSTSSNPPVCHSVLRGPNYAGKAYLNMLNVPGNVSVYDWQPVRTLLNRETLWDNKSSVGVGYPTFPRMIYQGNADDVINYGAVEAYVKQQCAKGADIQFNVYTANAHTAPQLVLGGDLNAMRFVLQVFKLKGMSWNKVPCGQPTPSLLNLATLAADAFLGADVIGALQRLLQQEVTSLANVGFGPTLNRVNTN